MICTHAVRPAKIQSVNSLINIVQGLVLTALEENTTEQRQSEKSSIVIVYLTAWSVDALTYFTFILLKFWKLLVDETLNEGLSFYYEIPCEQWPFRIVWQYSISSHTFSDPRPTQSCIRQVNIKRHSSVRMLSVGYKQKEKSLISIENEMSYS